MGVPGAKSFHLLAPGYGNPTNLQAGLANPYYVRFADPTNFDETVVEAAVRANPTFFSLWIGNNDVLGYSTTGGEEGSDAITDANTFNASYAAIVASLTADGAKGVVANIPDVTSIPFFTTVQWNALEISAAQAAALNAGFATYNQAIQGNLMASLITQEEADFRTISFSAGSNGLVMMDPSLTQLRDAMGVAIPGSFLRQVKKGELITLGASGDSIRCAGLGSVDTRVNPPVPNPLPGNLVLDMDEISAVQTAVSGYNATIKSVADANGLAFVDANARLKELATTGIVENGISFSSSFISGGAFSLDGVHPNTRGYAIIANDFIDAINLKYGSNIAKVDVSSYPAFEIEQ